MKLQTLVIMVAIASFLIIGASGCQTQTAGFKSAELKQGVVGPVMYVVEIKNFEFNPAELTIKANDTVMWINKDPYPTVHTASADDLIWSLKMIAGQNFSKQFNNTGEYPYHCAVHKEKGKIIVR